MFVFTAQSSSEAPIGETIGPLLFWPILAILLAVIVWATLRRIRRRDADGPRRDWTDPSAYDDHHTVRWRSDPRTYAPTAGDWPLGVTAIHGICEGTPWDELRQHDPHLGDGIAEAWGIASRPEILSTIIWLLREGHRVEFDDVVEDAGGIDDETMAKIEAEARSGTFSADSRERLWRLQQVRGNARGIRSIDFSAWDLVRAANLARSGYTLGWLTEDEARDTLGIVAHELQRSFAGWEQLGEHFRTGRWFWGGTSGPTSQQNDAHDASRQRALLTAPLGPWSHLPWTQPLADTRFLIVEALVDEGLAEGPPISSPTRLAAAIDTVLAARLDHRS